MSMGQILNTREFQAWVADKGIGLDETGKYLDPSQFPQGVPGFLNTGNAKAKKLLINILCNNIDDGILNIFRYSEGLLHQVMI